MQKSLGRMKDFALQRQSSFGRRGHSKDAVEMTFKCDIRLQDDQKIQVEVSKEAMGQWLFDEACEKLGRVDHEKDYFGLRYQDKHKQKQWLDLSRNAYIQLRNTSPMAVSFRVKHYPNDPIEDLKLEKTRNLLYLQLRRDLYSGRLLGKSSDLYTLAALVAQCEFGDNNDEEGKYLTGIKILPNVNSRMESKIVEIHKTLSGLDKFEAKTQFLETACQLDTYGVEPFFVKDRKGNNLYVGLTHKGLSTFQGSRRAHLFKWSDVCKMHSDGKLFIVQVILEETFNGEVVQKKHALGFKCETRYASLALWKWAVDRQCFFTLSRSSAAKKVKSGGGIFRKSSTFRFTGKCHQEVLIESATIAGSTLSLDARRGSFDLISRSMGDGKYGTLPGRIGHTAGSKNSINHEGTVEDLFLNTPGTGRSAVTSTSSALDEQDHTPDNLLRKKNGPNISDSLHSILEERMSQLQETKPIINSNGQAPTSPSEEHDNISTDETILTLRTACVATSTPSSPLPTQTLHPIQPQSSYCGPVSLIFLIFLLSLLSALILLESRGKTTQFPILAHIYEQHYSPLKEKLIKHKPNWI